MSKRKSKSFSFTLTIEVVLLVMGLWFSWHHNWLALVATVSVYWLLRYR
jgi:hypothetical protein